MQRKREKCISLRRISIYLGKNKAAAKGKWLCASTSTSTDSPFLPPLLREIPATHTTRDGIFPQRTTPNYHIFTNLSKKNIYLSRYISSSPFITPTISSHIFNVSLE
ncbi:hypothetical protein ACMFMF_001342 [Clarireedia jacksonii]